ncbi:DUF4916 domain-containing protein [Microbacterium sp. MTN4-26]|uniref:DUF4916 domain-containing protein n=1 Tax=unclassified Microbacterium TaxID=2609290 RepID=UPI0036F2FC36
MSFLPPDLYRLVEESMPIACVDFILLRDPEGGGSEVGLIRRDSPFGEVWCHLGGRVLRGETIRDALLRHADDTLAVDLELPLDPQPSYVYQWFPPDITPDSEIAVGSDPRKHAIGLSFVARTTGAPNPRHEAHDFGWFPADALPDPLWPGCVVLIEELLSRQVS